MSGIKRWIMVAGLCAVAAALLAAIAFRDSGPLAQRTPDRLESLRLGAYDGDVGALQWIAHDKGFFRQAGLDVTILGYPSGNHAVNAMRAGEVDVATAADLVVAKRSFDEPDLRILADICRYWNKGLIGRRDRGIAAPADLKGKRIAVPATSSAEHNLIVFLALQGLSPDDVTIMDLPPAKLVEAIAAGTVDAALVWQPHVLAIERRLGDNAVTLMDGGTEAHLLLVTSSAYLPDHADTMTRLMRAMLMAERWVAANPKDAKAYLVSRFALEPDYVELLWPRMQFTVSLPQEILAAMDNSARWIAKGTGRQAIPDFSETIHAAPLSSVAPSMVHVFTK